MHSTLRHVNDMLTRTVIEKEAILSEYSETATTKPELQDFASHPHLAVDAVENALKAESFEKRFSGTAIFIFICLILWFEGWEFQYMVFSSDPDSRALFGWTLGTLFRISCLMASMGLCHWLTLIGSLR